MRRLFVILKPYRSIAFYMLSIALGRGLSIFALPFISRFMAPSDYARLDVAASLIEISGIIASFALADLMFRFVALAKTDSEQRKVAGGILGLGLICAVVTLILTQIFLPVLASSLVLGVHEPVLRAGLAAAACTGLIELPLAWLRLRDRPALYFSFIAGRSVSQMSVMLIVLWFGYGPEGVVLSNAAIDATLTVVLVFKQLRSFGISFSKDMLRHAFSYSLPIVGGGLAMFGLGSCDRFFLAGSVEAQTLAHYTLAGKLAFATPLLMQPFALWWNPKRIAILNEPNGLTDSARFVTFGFTILICAGIFVVTAGTLFLHLAMPVSYHGAVLYLPWMVLLSVLNELCSLLNVGSFSRSHSSEILIVNSAGGIFAVLCYMLFVPQFNVHGAILATLLGHSIRIFLFVILGRRNAPIAYPFVQFGCLLMTMTVFLYVWIWSQSLWMQICFGVLALAAVLVQAVIFNILPRSEFAGGAVKSAAG